jgi:replication factor C subunit 3/5
VFHLVHHKTSLSVSLDASCLIFLFHSLCAMLWIDKHEPKTLEALSAHRGLNERLLRLSRSSNFPHLLFHGPSGSGKKTRIHALLRATFGPVVDKMHMERKELRVGAARSRKVQVEVVSSPAHLEFSPSDSGLYDRDVVQQTVKEIAQSVPLQSLHGHRFKVVVLHGVDHMTREAQQSLRRTMEKYIRNCRMILCCEGTAQVIDPLVSRCLSIRIPCPPIEEVTSILSDIATKEGFAINEPVGRQIAEYAGRNVRRAILMMETLYVHKRPFPSEPFEKGADAETMMFPDWEKFTLSIANDVLSKQSPQTILSSRERVTELLGRGIPPSFVLRRIALELIRKSDDTMRHVIATEAARFEHRIHTGSKPIFHIEAFIVRFMAEFQKQMQDIMMDMEME